MMRFCSLGSGSSGNATLIEASSGGGRPTRVLVDCGLTLRELARRLAWHGLALSDLDAVFITHEHSDHVGSSLALVRRHGMPLWTSEGTWEAMRRESLPPASLRFACDGQPIAVGALQITPFAVPHDAQEPLQLTCSNGAVRLGILTDLGEGNPDVLRHLQGLDALLLECNHDAQMLADGPYPAFLKRRVGGARGHLANHQSSALLAACAHARLKHVVAAHLSQQNNRPDLAAAALATALGTHADDIIVADASLGCPWLQLA